MNAMKTRAWRRAAGGASLFFLVKGLAWLTLPGLWALWR